MIATESSTQYHYNYTANVIVQSLVYLICNLSMLIFTLAIFTNAQHILQLVALAQNNGSYLLALILLP